MKEGEPLTPLHCAYMGGNADAVALLMERGANHETEAPGETYVTHFAAMGGNVSLLQRLRGEHWSLTPKTVRLAAQHGRGDAVAWLSQESPGGFAGALRGVLQKGDEGAANMLLSKWPSDVSSPLPIILESASKEVAPKLLKRFADGPYTDRLAALADIRPADMIGRDASAVPTENPLLVALAEGNIEGVRSLLAAGVKTDVFESVGVTPLQEPLINAPQPILRPFWHRQTPLRSTLPLGSLFAKVCLPEPKLAATSTTLH